MLGAHLVGAINMVLALDLEETLISSAVSQFPRPWPFEFLQRCQELFPRISLVQAASTELYALWEKHSDDPHIDPEDPTSAHEILIAFQELRSVVGTLANTLDLRPGLRRTDDV